MSYMYYSNWTGGSDICIYLYPESAHHPKGPKGGPYRFLKYLINYLINYYSTSN